MEFALTGRIVSLHVGRPQKLVTASGKPWESAIAKESVIGPVVLGAENLEGDYQANRKYHGGPDKAICGFSSENYPALREALGQALPFGAFGENVTVEGLTEDKLCIGDTLSVGTALLQITQPRQPCANISKRWNAPALPRIMEETGFTGFYARVLRTGEMASGDTLTLDERPHDGWTIRRANALMYGENPDDAEAIQFLRDLPLLSAEWKRILGRKLRALTPEK